MTLPWQLAIFLYVCGLISVFTVLYLVCLQDPQIRAWLASTFNPYWFLAMVVLGNTIIFFSSDRKKK